MEKVLIEVEKEIIEELDRLKKQPKPELKIYWNKYDLVMYFDGACSFNKKLEERLGVGACIAKNS